ncbi:DUF1800 domain-containing protein [uncultured Psychroserpens sp.]|uniref:DUF1800 domain-containing protein n=1 Tax=uncultured Psychroserpens sp. TaxID=255436 RepID=UPI0026085027|nr:DUF1800 domain-containing protein [uncultured Psychroserpens sp.]
MTQQDIQHLYWRAGFGLTPKQYALKTQDNRDTIIDGLFKASEITTMLDIDTSDFEELLTPALAKDAAKRKLIRQISTKKLKTYNRLWLNRLETSNQILREKMTLFWANHFVCRDNNILFVKTFNNTLRAHALGNFGDFVKAISKEAAMLKYLNNKQNRKLKPNENFARELMELFMLGEGHYTERDIKESARAFTGYNHTVKGQFVLRKRQHDYGIKTFFRNTGRFSGDDIIDIILQQKQCARFICQSIYKYFVNETINTERLEELATVFFKDYNIENLMRHLFMSDWFYSEENIGVKIKSPIELLIGIGKTVPIKFNDEKDQLKIQKLLGQILLNPPNVAGWKGGKNWIDSNTLMLRLKLPSILLANAHISIKEKGEFEDSFDIYNYRKRPSRFANVSVDWNNFEEQFSGYSSQELKTFLMASKLNKGTENYLETLNKSSHMELCVQLMSLPEYQMC